MTEAILEQGLPKGTGREIHTLVVADLKTHYATGQTISTPEVYRSLLRLARAMACKVDVDLIGYISAIDDRISLDIAARAELGRQRYGERLRAHNGRDAKVDLYQEILDALMYCAQLLEEER